MASRRAGAYHLGMPKPTYTLMRAGFLAIGVGLFQLWVDPNPAAWMVIAAGTVLVIPRVFINGQRVRWTQRYLAGLDDARGS